LSKIRLTIRHGSKVRRKSYESVEQAVTALRDETRAIRADGGLPEVTAFKTYEPSALVHARLEISTGGPFRGRDAGIDLMGDGGLVPFRGGLSRHPLDATDGSDAFDAVAKALDG
jgi:hypothetical protein